MYRPRLILMNLVRKHNRLSDSVSVTSFRQIAIKQCRVPEVNGTEINSPCPTSPKMHADDLCYLYRGLSRTSKIGIWLKTIDDPRQEVPEPETGNLISLKKF